MSVAETGAAPRKPLLKVCGLRDAETAAATAELDVDYVGFVFAPSKRRVTPPEARAMIDAIRSRGGRAKFAGVFVDPSPDELAAILDVAPLDVVQLHGAESGDFAQAVRERFPAVRVWKAIGVAGEAAHEPADVAVRLSEYEGRLDGLLLDAYDPHVGGGTGRTFRWDAIPAYAAWTKGQGVPLFVAGGLHEGNVAELLDGYGGSIGGVDVSSGVETDGRKDLVKIRTFAKRVKSR